MCNLSWTPYSNLEKGNSLNHSCVSNSRHMGCLEYTYLRTENMIKFGIIINSITITTFACNQLQHWSDITVTVMQYWYDQCWSIPDTDSTRITDDFRVVSLRG